MREGKEYGDFIEISSSHNGLEVAELKELLYEQGRARGAKYMIVVEMD